MVDYDKFKESLKKAAEEVKKWDDKTIRLISHLDADGISAISILIKALNNENRKYVVSIIPQIQEKIIDDLKREDYEYYIFTDLGSGSLSRISELAKNKKILILDHHDIEEVDVNNENIIHINPHLFGINGSKEISGAGVVYMFTRYLNDKNNMSHIAIVGAIGDIQDREGFSGLNTEIIESAIKNKKLHMGKGLRFFGIHTKPLHKVLEYCTDPMIPGISGSESSAIQFLNSIGINPQKEKGWRKFSDLTETEKKKLAAAIIMKRIEEEIPEDVFGNVCTLIAEERDTPFRDAKEFSTLLNACGRLKKASIGIGACLNNERAKSKAMTILAEYKKEIVQAMRWYNGNKNNFIQGKGYMIINAEENIKPTIIGTLASILSKSNIAENTFILSMAQNNDMTTKVSLRISKTKKKNINLREIVEQITKTIGGEVGGHKDAAGALIRTEKEEEFLASAKEVLSKISMEEFIE